MSGRKVARGIYRDAYGYELRWQEAGRTRTKRYPGDTPLDILKQQRASKVRLATQVAPKQTQGSFPRDAARWLKSRKGAPSFKSDRAHLRPWVHRFKLKSRWVITPEAIRTALDEWRRRGYAARTLRHRLRVLKSLYQTFDQTEGPCAEITTPTPPKRRPRAPQDEMIRAVARALLIQEKIGRLRDAKTRARFLVDATCGQRPIQHMRATPADVDLERRLWFVDPAKGDEGTVLYLNDDQLAAWTLFSRARAWGRYDRRSYAKTLRRNGWPKGVRPYAMRHAVGLALSELGFDLGDIQQHMGHADLNTTRRFYVPGLMSRAKAVSEKLTGRLGVDSYMLTTTTGSEERAKTRQNPPRSARGSRAPVTGTEGPKSVK